MISCDARAYCLVTVEQGPMKAWFLHLGGELIGVGYHHRVSGIIQRWRRYASRNPRSANYRDWRDVELLARSEFDRKVQLLLRQVPFA